MEHARQSKQMTFVLTASLVFLAVALLAAGSLLVRRRLANEALKQALVRGNVAQVREALLSGADINVFPGGGCTVLMAGAEYGDDALVRQWLDRHLPVDGEDNVGNRELRYGDGAGSSGGRSRSEVDGQLRSRGH